MSGAPIPDVATKPSEAGEFEVAAFPKLEFSKKDVIRAGTALKGDMIWNQNQADEILRTFRIANSWRASHAFPMHRMRAELHGRMSALKVKGLTAARLKQMSSIRGKLNRIGSNLRQMQDLGGCRAIVPNADHAKALVASILDKFSHELKRENPYMDDPRDSGYRSHHLIFSFQPRNDEEAEFTGRLIELQIRSRLQHSWATAVEAVGMYRGEQMKAGQGDTNWLRLFQLMSLEFAHSEGWEYAAEGRQERVKEIIDLSHTLDAEQTLNTLSHAVSDLERMQGLSTHKTRYCLIQYDHTARKVQVKYLNGPSKIGHNLNEVDYAGGSSQNKSSVVVELDKIENLRQAYPNYFGDVQLFRSSLSMVLHGNEVKEYSLPPVERVPPPPKEIPDDSWLRFPNRRRWE